MIAFTRCHAPVRTVTKGSLNATVLWSSRRLLRNQKTVYDLKLLVIFFWKVGYLFEKVGYVFEKKLVMFTKVLPIFVASRFTR